LLRTAAKLACQELLRVEEKGGKRLEEKERRRAGCL